MAELEQTHNIIDKDIPGWFFKCWEESANHFIAEGKTKNGNIVSSDGVDGDEVLAQCKGYARELKI